MRRHLAALALLAFLYGMATPAPASPSLTMQRQVDNNGAQARLDRQLMGRWVHQSMISSSGGAGGSASFSTERQLEFGADGHVRQWVRSAGGGGNWSTQSGRRLEFSGRWQARDGAIWVQPEGEPGYQRAVSYRFAGEYLVTEGLGGRRIWAR